MPRHSQQFCLCLCSFYIARNSLYTCRGVIFGRKSQAEKSSRTCFKATLRREKELKTSTQNRLKRPQIRKAALLGKYDRSRKGREEEGAEDCYRFACRHCRRHCSAAEMATSQRTTPTVGGRDTQRDPKGVATVEFCSLLSESMTQCVFFLMEQVPFSVLRSQLKG